MILNHKASDEISPFVDVIKKHHSTSTTPQKRSEIIFAIEALKRNEDCRPPLSVKLLLAHMRKYWAFEIFSNEWKKGDR